jgi:murein DD-endopeptidase MepM/ murein hydrolase activator NlpD
VGGLNSKESPMKNKLWIYIAASVVTLLIIFFPPLSVWFQTSNSAANPGEKKEPIQANEDATNSLEKRGKDYRSLSELLKEWKYEVNINSLDGEIELIKGKVRVTLYQETPVLKVNGEFAPLSKPPLKENNEFWLAPETVKEVERVINDQSKIKQIPALATQRVPVKEMIKYLSFLEVPIKGAHVSTKESQLPGAPRTYRNGYHEGTDWYDYTTGVKITKKTPVYSIADGVVVRVDHDYKELTDEERNRLLKLSSIYDRTPEYALDKLRGRSVWVQCDKGVLARYAHLDRVNEDLKVGDRIKQGDYIGNVGNSGTSDGVLGNSEGLHLHLDLLIYGEWFWENYTMKERRRILENIF